MGPHESPSVYTNLVYDTTNYLNNSLLKFNSITEAAIEEERRRELQDRLAQLDPTENEEDEVSKF